MVETSIVRRIASDKCSSALQKELDGQAEQNRLEELAKWRAKQRLCPDTKVWLGLIGSRTQSCLAWKLLLTLMCPCTDFHHAGQLP